MKAGSPEDILSRRVTHIRSSLAVRCRALATHMNQVATSLESDLSNELLSINNLGEIQGQGPMLDAKCGELSAFIETLELIQKDKTKLEKKT